MKAQHEHITEQSIFFFYSKTSRVKEVGVKYTTLIKEQNPEPWKKKTLTNDLCLSEMIEELDLECKLGKTSCLTEHLCAMF